MLFYVSQHIMNFHVLCYVVFAVLWFLAYLPRNRCTLAASQLWSSYFFILEINDYDEMK